MYSFAPSLPAAGASSTSTSFNGTALCSTKRHDEGHRNPQPDKVTIECKRSNRPTRSSRSSRSPRSSPASSFPAFDMLHPNSLLFSGGGAGAAHDDGRRKNRVGELIKREIGPIVDTLFHTEYKKVLAEPEDAANILLLSVVNVKVSDDLRKARVYMSVLLKTERTKQVEEVLAWLRDVKKEVRYKLAGAVSMKYIPDLSFHKCEMQAATDTVSVINRLQHERQQKEAHKHPEDNATDVLDDDDDELEYDISLEDDGLLDEDDDDNDMLLLDNTQHPELKNKLSLKNDDDLS